MYCKTIFFLILCANPLIEAADLKIDGLLSLGDSWSYEYRILRTDSSKRPYASAQEDAQEKSKEVPQEKNDEDLHGVAYRKREEEVTRDKEKDNAGEVHEDSAHDRKNEYDEDTSQDEVKEVGRRRDEEIAHYNDKIARQKDEEDARIQRDTAAERLRLSGRVLRDEAGRLRKEVLGSKMNQSQGKDQRAQIHHIHKPKKHKTVAKNRTSIRSRHLKTETVGTTETSIPKRSRQTKESDATNEAITEDSSSGESHNSDTPEKRVTNINDDNATENLKKLLQDTATDHSDTQCTHSDSSDISANFKKKIRQRHRTDSSASNSDPSDNIVKVNKYTTPKYAKELINETLQNIVKKIILKGENIIGNLTKSTKVTTVRTGEIFTDSHEVLEDKKILDFTIHLYTETLKIFGRIKEKTDQNHVKHKIESLMRSYQDKFKEFVIDRNRQKIKTRLGTQKVILNTIDTSNLLLRRLINFLLSDLDKHGILRQNTGTANRFQKAIDLELKQQSLHACEKFGICRTPGFSSFLSDILGILLNVDDVKLKQSMDAFTEVLKYMKFTNILEPETEKKLKIIVNKIETLDIKIIRAAITVLKNTMMSQNKPVIVSHYSARKNIVQATVAFFEVIDMLDLLIPPNKDNSLQWDQVKLSLKGFAAGQRTDIQEIMTNFLRGFRKNLRNLDTNSKAIISKNLGIILSMLINKYG